MTVSARSGAYVALGSAGLVLGIALSEAMLVALGSALLVPIAYMLAATPPSLPHASVRLSASRVLEDGLVDVEVTLTAERSVVWLALELVLPDGVEVVHGQPRQVVSLTARERRRWSCVLRCSRWGAFSLGRLQLDGGDAFGIRAVREEPETGETVRVYPALERVRALVRPRATRPAGGARPAATPGEGIEFAELRPLAPGERARRINWRASAARRTLLVSDRLPERSSDIVVFLDSLGVVASRGASTLDHSLRAAASVAGAYLRQRDRVGLLRFGGELEWVLPGSGSRQLMRIVDAVLESEAARMYRWRDTSLIPRRVLPPQSLVLAITPLLDWRVSRALLNLRRRRYDLAVIEVDPVPFAADARGRYGDLAWRLWLLQRELARSRFAKAGVAVARWETTQPVAPVLEELAARRR